MKNHGMGQVLKKGLIFMVALTSISASAQSGGNFQITKSVIGVATEQSGGGGYRINASIGQKFNGVSENNEYILRSGFWQENNDLIFFDRFELGE